MVGAEEECPLPLAVWVYTGYTIKNCSHAVIKTTRIFPLKAHFYKSIHFLCKISILASCLTWYFFAAYVGC
jgi:hypothetical protein